MAEDVQAALERFQNFIGRFDIGAIIDGQSSFSQSDALLLVGEVEMAAINRLHEQHSRSEEE